MAHSFLDVIEAWPDMVALSEDVGESHSAVKQWKRRQSIPPEYWRTVETAARKRGYEWITVYVLMAAAEQRFGKSAPATNASAAA